MSYKGPGNVDHEAIRLILSKHKKGCSVLQIGARNKGSWHKIQKIFTEVNINQHDILEVWDANVKHLRSSKDTGGEVFHCNVLDMHSNNQTKNKTWDWIIWWHGPEHVKKEEFRELLPKISKMYNVGFIVGCPFGTHEQGSMYGNNFEAHISHWKDTELEKMGFTVYTYGSINSGTLAGCIIKDQND